MHIRVIRLGGGRRSGLLFGVLALGAGALLLVFGLVLLVALATIGVAAGAGALLLRSLRRGGRDPRADLGAAEGWRGGLDPRLEVRPPAPSAARLDNPERR